MIAFKTFAQAPESQRPDGIPLEWPWIQEPCNESLIDVKEAAGFQVVTKSSYETYKSLHQAAYDVWQNSQPKKYPILSPRQIRLALIGAGISLSQIDSAIDAMSSPQKEIAKVTWEYALEYERGNSLVEQMAQAFGWTTQQLDDLWSIASQL